MSEILDSSEVSTLWMMLNHFVDKPELVTIILSMPDETEEQKKAEIERVISIATKIHNLVIGGDSSTKGLLISRIV